MTFGGIDLPIVIPKDLPASKILNDENIFVMNENMAMHQDIRPLKIAIVNLMPTKIETETQLLRLIGNTPLQVDVEFVNTRSHKAKNISEEHLVKFYKSFEEIKNHKFDGMIITGAPIENLKFEEVDYWRELEEIMEYSKTNVTSTLHICWGAQAGLYYHFGIPKLQLPEKIFGVFPHYVLNKNSQLLRGFDDEFFAPHSRYTEVKRSDIEQQPSLEILAESSDSGVYLISSKDGKQIFVTGHSEYDDLTLKAEYDRDVNKGLNIKPPENYFSDDDPTKAPKVKWKSHANLLFLNWLNYYVYQETPYVLES